MIPRREPGRELADARADIDQRAERRLPKPMTHTARKMLNPEGGGISLANPSCGWTAALRHCPAVSGRAAG